MSLVRVHNFSISLDGFGAGEGQTFEAPFGHAGHRLHEWFFPTRTFQEMRGEPGGSAGIDDAFAKDWADGIGAERSWDATSSGTSAGRGLTRSGEDGGATIRHSTLPCSS